MMNACRSWHALHLNVRRFARSDWRENRVYATLPAVFRRLDLSHCWKEDATMSLGLILVIILIIFLLGGFSGRFGGYGYGYGHGGVGLIGIILIILVVLLLMGRI
jgi:hypothetical protein